MTTPPFDTEMTLLTPSFEPDLERCELLVESVAQCAPHMKHWLVVDSREVAKFKHLENVRTTIVPSEDLIGRWLRPLPFPRGYWGGLTSLPVRGWMLQQIKKIAASLLIDTPAILCTDSDVAFVRPFSYENFMVDGKLGLLDVDFVDDNIVQWTDIARDMLHISSGTSYRNHVGQLIAWKKDVVRQLTDTIETSAKTSWQRVIGRKATFSEYITYGAFVREKIGYAAADQHPSTVPLVHALWGHDVRDEHALTDFFGSLADPAIAAMVHSKDNIPVQHYRKFVEEYWRNNSR